MKGLIALLFVAFAALAAGGAWFYFNGASDAPTEPSGTTAQADSTQGGTVEQVIEKIIPKGPPAPEIVSSVWLNSPALSTQDLRGHVVVVEFWTFG